MTRVAMISYGEVGGILAAGLRQAGVAGIRVHDTAPTARARAIAAEWCDTHAQAVDSADLVIVAVTAASALEAVRSFAPSLSRETFVLDVNSVSPATKQAAAETVERAGGRYVEAAVMTSVPPRGLASPMLLGGPHASVVHGSGGGAEALGDVGDRYPQPRMPIVPFKLNQDRRHHIPRQGHRVTNWPAYDASLRQRGSLTVWFTDEVRHITWRWIPFAERRRGLEEMTLGPAAYPVVKAKRDSSMPSKRERSEDAYGRVPQGPRNMLRTGLFEPQPPAMQVNVPRHSVLGVIRR